MSSNLTLLKKIIKEVKVATTHSVKVGLASDVGFYPSGETVVGVGTQHEFGLGVPRRSFLRASFSIENSKIKKQLENGMKNIISGQSAKVNLNKVGLLTQGIAKGSFKNQGYGKWQDISQYTKDKKGSSKILFDTGRLVQSITFWIYK